MARRREIIFKVFYSSSFTFVFLLLITFCGVAPADQLYESYHRRRIVDIITVAAAWVLTACIAAFVYCTRLYTTRGVLRDIPKTYLPIEREDLPGRNVFSKIQEVFARTAVIAYQAKPRGRRIEKELEGAAGRMLVVSGQIKMHRHAHTLTKEEQNLLEPKWGDIKHPGWQSPASEAMAGLEYAKVADELMDLIEAKAVSLAPADPTMTPLEDGTLPPDERVVDALTRPEGLGMRSYIAQLAEMGVLPDSDVSVDFLTVYEHSRFSGKPMAEVDFQTMMRLFAELLRTMRIPEQDLLDFSPELGGGADDSDDQGSVRKQRKGKSPASQTVERTPQRRKSTSTTLSHASSNSVVHKELLNTTASSDPVLLRESSPAAASISSPSLQSLHTTSDSGVPQPDRTAGTRMALPAFTSTRPAARSSISNQSRHLDPATAVRPPLRTDNTHSTMASGQASFYSASSSQASLHSVRSAMSGRSSQGSVIRLVQADAGNRDVGSGDGPALPYEIDVSGFGNR